MSLWKSHPHVRSGQRLTVGERAADRMRNGMGSWPFVFAALVFLAVWMAFNRDTGFDPFPFIDRKSTRLNSSHSQQSRMPSSA